MQKPNILELKTINDLKQFSFHIPAYQRGYRWSEREVSDLLRDISEFQPLPVADTNKKTWYCLQPIVIRKRSEGKYEVIDGQQRLTTIYLILHFLNQEGSKREKIFGIDYETRKGTEVFLENLKENSDKPENIDFYYINEAYKAISSWFEDQNFRFNVDRFKDKLKSDTKVIWYETREEDPVEIFTRINSGKIPLTNAELIKSLFLNNTNFAGSQSEKEKLRKKQLKIVTEWDNTELAFQNDGFWFFLTNNISFENRIELIFDLMNNNTKKNEATEDEEGEDDTSDWHAEETLDIEDISKGDVYKKYDYATFRFFNEKFNNTSQASIGEKQAIIEKYWQEVQVYFQCFKEWHKDRELYHKIGYLITVKAKDIKYLYDKSRQLSAADFKAHLDELIKKDLAEESWEKLYYGNKNIKKVLLLYNILTMLGQENSHDNFSFDSYKKEKWDIEHIASRTYPTNPKKRKEWLTQVKNFLGDTSQPEPKKAGKLKLELEKYLESEQKKDNDFSDDEKFGAQFENITDHFCPGLEDDSDRDYIWNLALLDRGTNRAYKNDAFPVKKQKIIDRAENGKFVPICTKNVFLKQLSKKVTHDLLWTADDRKKYEKDIKQVLKGYIK